MDPETGPATDSTDASRWEITAGDQVAGYLSYDRQPGVVALRHTVVDPAYEGRGLASQLVQAAFDDARSGGAAVLPYCSYVRSWLGRHPEQVELVPADRRGEFGLQQPR